MTPSFSVVLEKLNNFSSTTNQIQFETISYCFQLVESFF